MTLAASHSRRARAARLAPALAAAALAAAALAPAALAAQGSLGTQGYGYPTGQLSTRALGAGGSFAEFDPASPLNPAAISYFRRATLSAQYDPEFRRTTSGGSDQSATIARFPVISAGFPVRNRIAVAFSASTYLDRTFVTSYETTSKIGDETVTSTQDIESRGSIADIRLGAGVIAARWLRFGVAGHLLTGENRLVSGRFFADTGQFASVSDSTTLSYSGAALSGGVELTPVRWLTLAGSVRQGLDLRVQRNDSTLRTGSAPNRIGVGLRFDGVTGASFAATYARTEWSRMRGLGSTTFEVRDAPEFSAGVEALGPRLGNTATLFRLGGRSRTLPFGLGDAGVKERSFAGGLGLPFGGGRAYGDLGLQYASRRLDGSVGTGTAGLSGDARERAWTLSVGFTVRP